MRGVGNLTREMHRRSEASEGTRSRKRSPEGAARRCAYANQRMTLYSEIGKISVQRRSENESKDEFEKVSCNLEMESRFFVLRD